MTKLLRDIFAFHYLSSQQNRCETTKNSVPFITKRVSFMNNAHKFGRIFVEPLYHNFVQYSYPWWIKPFSRVHVPWFLRSEYVEELIIIFNILSICIPYWLKGTFKPFPWHIHIRCTFRNCQILCLPPVLPVVDSDPVTDVEPISKPPYKLSRFHWMFQNLIRFVDEYLFQIVNRKYDWK